MFAHERNVGGGVGKGLLSEVRRNEGAPCTDWCNAGVDRVSAPPELTSLMARKLHPLGPGE